MFERLDEVDWAKVRACYGPATEVPVLIRAVASADKEARAEVFWKLHGALWHQGSIYEASARAVPFLLELLEHESRAEPWDLLLLLHGLATGRSYHDVHGAVFAGIGRDRDDLERKAKGELAHVRSAHEGAEKGVDLYLRLLESAYPMVRAGAAHTLSAFSSRKALVAPRLREAIQREKDDLARGGLLLSLGAVRDESPATSKLLEETLATAAELRERYAAAYGLSLARRGEASSRAMRVIAEVAAQPVFADQCFRGLPWDWSAEVVAGDIVSELGTAAAPVILRVLLDALPNADRVAASFLCDNLMDLVFPEGKMPEGPANEDQRRVLLAIADADRVWEKSNLFISSFRERGLVPKEAGLNPKNWFSLREHVRALANR